ncbi:MAG: dockerin type I repeat-containing protein, partial [Ruminococcus sp.]|nr:dockerin type I repeat-containing protein [Ruminococcus sp.]
NENSRTLALTVADDSSVTKPIIKSVTPANLNLIKAGVTNTVTVTAGGGKTGTNLLFYKYIVTDPNGVKNTPYYTLNNTYQFTPTMAGNYVVNVYVQASDNSTVTKTYNYTATADGPIPTQPVTVEQPTTAKPTTPVATTAPVTTTPQPTTPSGYNKGDANMDHYFNIKDATYVQMHIAEYDEAKDIVIELADMSGDGRITVLDATLIQQALLK